MPEEKPPVLNTISVACSRFGLTRTGLYERLGRGELHAVKIGRRTLVTEDSLQRFAAGLPPAKIASPRARAA